MSFANANGIRLHYASAGAGSPVLLLHGFPETHRSWDQQLPFLAQHGFRAIAADLRGYGESDRPKYGYDLETLAADVAALIDALGCERVTLIGHDWGGAVAWEVLTRYPEKISRAVVLACPHPLVMARALRRNRQQLRRSWYMFFFQLPLLPELWLTKNSGRNIARMFRESPGGDRAPREIIQSERDALGSFAAIRRPLAYYRTAIRSALTPPTELAKRYPPIEVPVGIIWGEHDSCLGLELVEPSARLAKKSEIRIVQGAGHFVHQERPDEVNRLLLELCVAARE